MIPFKWLIGAAALAVISSWDAKACSLSAPDQVIAEATPAAEQPVEAAAPAQNPTPTSHTAATEIASLQSGTDGKAE